ncbi:MAG: MarR family transcriptional regulator [Anaerolineales bacterium]|nr:MarR family transcriptional regulator [Anaerolineales bacterium]
MTKSPSASQSLRAFMDVFMHRSMRGWSQFAKGTGLSMPQVSILMQLHHKGACGISTIGERFDISNAAASQLVEKLVQGGYVNREEDPNDRRSKLLNLTPKGLELLQEGMEQRHRWLDGLLKNLSTDEKSKVSEALGILTEKAKEVDR